jgi:serine/threonine protein phosphatase PrpC
MSTFPKTKLTTAIEPMSKNQDYVCSGVGKDVETKEHFEWVMLNDGHGTNTCIQALRNMSIVKKTELIAQRHPVEALAADLDASGHILKWESSGATAVIVKRFATRIECICAGDSRCMVFENQSLVYTSTPHNAANPSERMRVAALGASFEDFSEIQLTSETTMTLKPSLYTVFRPLHPAQGRQLLAPTQSLGHNSKTGYAPEYFRLDVVQGTRYRIVLGSDGLFDMLMLDHAPDLQNLADPSLVAQDICNWAKTRWLQTWHGHFSDGTRETFAFRKEQCDDISVAIMDI